MALGTTNCLLIRDVEASRREDNPNDSMTQQLPYEYRPFSPAEMKAASERFLDSMSQRRSVRSFSSESFPIEVLQQCIACAGTAPSGAHRQPWHFVIVANPDVKSRIRMAAEREEREFYSTRAPDEWLEALAPLGTDANKEYLETAPYLVVLFAVNFGKDGDARVKHYYVSESAGIAAGFFIAAVHQAGLCTLTHTPSPMGFLADILERPENERPFLLMPVGFPAEGSTVPDLRRKSLSEICSVI
ncbi:MAG: nitroreductase family protein [Rhodothermales bacterium]